VVTVIGCTSTPKPFLIETTGCTLTNNLTFDGQPSSWNGCRVFWSGSPDDMLTVEATLSNTTGSFVNPAGGWIRATVHAPGGTFNGAPTSQPYASQTALPTSLAADQLALSMLVATCGDFGTLNLTMTTTADVGDRRASFSTNFPSYTCFGSGSRFTVAGSIAITASSPTAAAGDPNTVVGPLP
jgi:hypothetical protein